MNAAEIKSILNESQLDEVIGTLTCFQKVNVSRDIKSGDIRIHTGLSLTSGAQTEDYLGSIDATEVFKTKEDWKEAFIKHNGQNCYSASYMPRGLHS